MGKMVQCPNCNGRGMIGYGIKDHEGMAAFYDFECPFCKGKCWVSKQRKERWEKENAKVESVSDNGV